MSAVIVLHGGERVRVVKDWWEVVDELKYCETFADFQTEQTYPISGGSGARTGGGS